MADYTSQGNAAQQGKSGKAHYTDQAGRKHEAVIDKLNGDNADLTVDIDGQQQKLSAVPHSAVGGVHTWDHRS